MKYLVGILLLISGFLLGMAWNNSQSPAAMPTETNDTTHQVSFEDHDPPPNLNAAELATIRLFENAEPSVVYITTSNVRRDFFSRNIYEIPRGTGSGFIWDSEGHIVTNYHVIRGADRFQVTLSDRTTWDAELVGYAVDKDLAILKIDGDTGQLQPIKKGSSSTLKVGQSVYVIGNPFGYDRTLTTGVISALEREIKSIDGVPIREVIQTDAAINPGNSGGPLLDSGGRLIGVNTQIYSPSGAYAGIGFSIPVDILKWVVPDLIEFGEIRRPQLAVSCFPDYLTEKAEIKGALIRDVSPGSEADKAGLRATYRNRDGRIVLGDVIIAINEDQILSKNDITLALEKYEPGDVVNVKVLREKEEEIIQVRLEEPF